MRKLKCIIADDEPFALELLKGYIEQTSFLELIASFKNSIEAYNFIKENEIDVAYLDIQMPKLSGMDVARKINTDVKIIFTTAFQDYAIEGYDVNAVGYLLKPFPYNKFIEVSEKLLESEETISTPKDSDYIMIKADYKLWQISLADIIFFEGVKDYVKIHRQSTQKVLMPLMSLKVLEDKLKNKGFMRVQRSYIVNLNNIEVIEKSHIIFKDHRIKVSDKYKEDFQKFIENRFY